MRFELSFVHSCISEYCIFASRHCVPNARRVSTNLTVVSIISTTNTMSGTAKWKSVRANAGLTLPDSKQSTDRLLLVTAANATLAAANSQRTEPGAGMLMLPRYVVYCSHRFSACKQCNNKLHKRIYIACACAFKQACDCDDRIAVMQVSYTNICTATVIPNPGFFISIHIPNLGFCTSIMFA